MTTQTWTIGSILSAAQAYLGDRSSRGEAEALLAKALSVHRFELYTHFDRPLSADERAEFRRLLADRKNGRPLQYLTGRQAFRYLDLKMEPGVFIPRPETELLVEQVIKLLSVNKGPSRILELGTGSGAICLSLAKELDQASVVSVDICEAALRLAQANAAAHGISQQLTFHHGDLFSALPGADSFDAVVANPPYIPSGEIENLLPEVRDFEPRAALDGGESGLDFFKRITKEAPMFLRGSGLIAFEVGVGQHEAVSHLLSTNQFTNVIVSPDYSGIHRVVTATLQA